MNSRVDLLVRNRLIESFFICASCSFNTSLIRGIVMVGALDLIALMVIDCMSEWFWLMKSDSRVDTRY